MPDHERQPTRPAPATASSPAAPLGGAGPAAAADRRRHPRPGIRDMPLIQPVRGEVVNLSAGGMGLHTWDALAVNKEYFFTFGPEPARVRARGRVIWCRMRPSNGLQDWEPRYRAGIEFAGLPA